MICVHHLCFLSLKAFTTEFRVHWGQHLLRPEFAESTYYLYKVGIVKWHKDSLLCEFICLCLLFVCVIF